MSTQHTIPAFPVPPNEPIHSGDAGMTLRDYFAAQVIREPRYTGETHESMARQAYKIADAMMEWRK